MRSIFDGLIFDGFFQSCIYLINLFKNRHVLLLLALNSDEFIMIVRWIITLVLQIQLNWSIRRLRKNLFFALASSYFSSVFLKLEKDQKLNWNILIQCNIRFDSFYAILFFNPPLKKNRITLYIHRHSLVQRVWNEQIG